MTYLYVTLQIQIFLTKHMIKQERKNIYYVVRHSVSVITCMWVTDLSNTLLCLLDNLLVLNVVYKVHDIVPLKNMI